MSKIENTNIGEDLSLPRTVKTYCGEEVKVDFYEEEEDCGYEVSIGGKIYSLEEARKIQSILNEYL